MSRTFSAAFLVFGVLGLAGACSSSVTDGDSESHFLATCPPGCASGLECICGACTKPCNDDSTCRSLAVNATCVTHASCSTARTCDVECRTGSDCAAGSDCRSGYCRKGEPTPGGGTGGQRGDAALTDVVTKPTHDATSDRRLFDRTPTSGDEPTVDPTGATGIFDWDGGPYALPDGSLQTCWFPGTVIWSADPVSATVDKHRLAAPYYSHTTPAGRTCNAPLPDCGAAGITPYDVGAALRDPEARAAFLAAPKTYGLTDGSGTVVGVDGHTLHIGASCNGAVGCVDAPAGVLRVRDVLRQLASQEQGRGDCRPNVSCYLPPDPGLCNGAFPRFAYDPRTRACKQFTYGGCGGNDNRYETKAACDAACDFDPCAGLPTFDDPFDAGPGDSGNPEGCAGVAVTGVFLCAPDPGSACGCICSMSGHDASQCSLHTDGPGRTDATCP